jgi:tetratricopeptide (TPR) repeat protein
MRNWLWQGGLLSQWTEKAITRLEEGFANTNDENRSLWKVYIPHALYVLESDAVDKDCKPRLDLMWKYGKCLCADGRWNEAEAPIALVLETRQRTLGPDHSDTLTSMAALASIYSNQGRLEEAEKLRAQVADIRKRVLGTYHPNTLTSMADLASTYYEQGRWKEAEELGVQVMEMRKRVLGADHLDTLDSMANLASTYRDQRRSTEAEKLEAQVREIRKHGSEPNPIDSTGLCLLSLDGGGVRGLSTLYILKSIMDQLNHERKKTDLPAVKPCEVFDLVGGTGIGG